MQERQRHVLHNEPFGVPDDFSIEDYWHDAENTFKNSCIQNENYPVVIKLEKSKGDILDNLEVLEINVSQDHILATINMCGFQFAVDDIMKIIRYVEVIKPIELRDFLENELNRMLLKHKE